MSPTPEDQLAELIAALPPAPAVWVRAAVELPAARAAIDGIVERTMAAQAARSEVLADLEAALREAGVEPHRPLVERLRQRLSE
jgi:hypothetical protein